MTIEGQDMTTPTTAQPDFLMTPGEVAALLRVNPKTVTRWARAGKLTAVKTLGGHRRFYHSEVMRAIAGQVDDAAAAVVS